MTDPTPESQQLYDQLANEFWTSYGIAHFAPLGMKYIYNAIPWQPTVENPDPTLHIGQGEPEETIDKNRDAAWSMTKIKEAGEPNGWLSQWLSDAWITLIFTRWEEHYRPSFAKIFGVERAHIHSDVMGEIRHLRNDIVHHNGIATKHNAGRCRILNRFEPDTRISISSDDIKILLGKLEVQIAR